MLIANRENLYLVATSARDSREAAQECSPRRKPWDSDARNVSPEKGRKTLPHTSGNLVVHLIFSTKQRLPLIRSSLRSDLFAYLGGIVRELRDTAIIINGTTDHVHMLVRMRPSQSPADLVRLVKTNSSRWARARGNRDFAWQTGYGAFSVSESRVPDVTRYIAGQEEHHKRYSFQQEFLLFLKRNHVAFDEKYLWD